jgi:hypothetical protein
MKHGKQVVVMLHRPADHPRTSQGLRAAVGYLSAGLGVTVVLCGPARQVLSRCQQRDAPAALSRPIELLRLLGHEVLTSEEADLPALTLSAHAVVTW